MIKKLAGIHKSSASSRTAINTAIIYLQRFMAAGMALVTTPLILHSLGVKDYGIYTLTVSFVSMLSFLNWSLSSSTQRYIAFAIGEGNTDRIKKIFSTALVMHFVYALIILIVITGISYFFIDYLLNIPSGRMEDARNVLYVVAFITFFTILAIPFLGVLRANENFFAIAIIGVTESLLKLVIAVSLIYISGNRLIFYSVLLLAIAVVVYLMYHIIIRAYYKDVKVSFRYYDKELVREIASFLSWSFIGALAIMSRNQGVQYLINIFFGVVQNAAYGITMQVNSAMNILSQGISGSISPQIIKSAGAGDHGRMIFLMRTMSKFSIFSVSLLAIPLYFECPYILNLWLNEVPEGTVTYVRLTIIFIQIMLLSAGVQTVFDALGKVKLYNIYISILLILNLPISYVMFKMGSPSYTILLVGMGLELVSFNVRLQLLKKYLNFSVKEVYIDVLLRVVLPTIATSVPIYCLTIAEIHPFAELVLAFGITMVVYPFIIYKFSLESQQKEFLQGLIAKVLKRKKR